MNANTHSRLSALRALMRRHRIDVYLIVSDDFHASEYVGDYFKCREFISGFDGSAGTLVITQEYAGLWTDGRYFLQAQEQLEGTGIELMKQGEPGVPTVFEYLENALQDGMCLGYDGRTICARDANKIKKMQEGKSVRFIENVDLAGDIWENRPPFPAEPVWLPEEDEIGKSRREKLLEVRGAMKKAKADAFLLAFLDDIAWLYNIRGNDILYNPVVLSYTIITKETAVLYLNQEVVKPKDEERLKKDGVSLQPYLQIYEDVAQWKTGTTLMLDETTTNTALLAAVPDGVTILNETNPTTLAKAVKTDKEIENERQAHIQDGVAVTKMIYWLKKIQNTEEFRQGQITELTVSKRLERLRMEREGYLEQSFAPIIASGVHGAIVHYEPTEETDIPLEEHTFLLMDTGGQYLQGTTDITRTIAMGTLTYEQKLHYTAVLRGNLNLAAAKFKYGAAGTNLDVLARAPLWELGLDYNHGTGHGVGYLLNVHEGPNGFRQKEANNGRGAVLEAGMITSDEPGLYLEGKYGIRLENLILCKEAANTDFGKFMEFENLTMVPFDRDAVLPECMTERELELLNHYHEEVYEKIEGYLTDEEREWLKEAVKPIRKEC